jgi:hypothetical protein
VRDGGGGREGGGLPECCQCPFRADSAVGFGTQHDGRVVAEWLVEVQGWRSPLEMGRRCEVPDAVVVFAPPRQLDVVQAGGGHLEGKLVPARMGRADVEGGGGRRGACGKKGTFGVWDWA